mmetsp:Transcript_12775/g.57633  ORF Transcript_12775/g.57633 Transcript_12775/m.57633 type:complete len:337 (-) Transcript_12775:3140-4150(-)
MTVPSTPPRPPASPKFQLPPTTVSPQATRLDRVLDLVTSHEATIAENELRVLDLTKRVAEAEEGARARRDEDRRARDAVDASLRAELAAVKEAVRRVEGELASRSEERDALRDELRDLADERRADAAAALEETKAGFSAVLQDVVDRVAASLDAVRKENAVARTTRGDYASADEVDALRQRIASAESAARARESHGRETMNAMLDAMEQMKRRTAKLVGFYNEHVEAADRRRASSGRRGATSTDSFGFSAFGEERSDRQTGELARLLEENASLREQLARASSSRRGHGRAVEEAALARGAVESARRMGSSDSLDGDGADAKMTRSVRDSIGSVNGC